MAEQSTIRRNDYRENLPIAKKHEHWNWWWRFQAEMVMKDTFEEQQRNWDQTSIKLTLIKTTHALSKT